MKFIQVLRLVGPPVAVIAALALYGFPTARTPRSGGASCDDVVTLAVAHARINHKRLFVKFGSTWCGSCRKLQSFLKSPPVWSILSKHLEFVEIYFNEDESHKDLENPGAEAWMTKAGVKPAQPAYAILDEQGKVVTSSTKPSRTMDLGSVYGEPFGYEDVARFLHLLAEGLPGMSKDDLKKFRGLMEKDIETWKG